MLIHIISSHHHPIWSQYNRRILDEHAAYAQLLAWNGVAKHFRISHLAFASRVSNSWANIYYSLANEMAPQSRPHPPFLDLSLSLSLHSFYSLWREGGTGSNFKLQHWQNKYHNNKRLRNAKCVGNANFHCICMWCLERDARYGERARERLTKRCWMATGRQKISLLILFSWNSWALPKYSYLMIYN